MVTINKKTHQKKTGGFLFWEAHLGRITGIKIYNVMELDLAIKLGWVKTSEKVWIFEVLG